MGIQFEIDVYNRYNLPKGAKTSTCPLCSHERKPQNQKQKCLMLDWQRGLGTCQHCGEVIQLHSYKSKKEENKIYTLPPPLSSLDLPEKIIKYFKSRGISERALRIAKVTHGIDWMPQEQREVNTIHFNYFENNILVNTKYRSAKKGFKLHSKAKLVLSGIDRWKDEKELIITEGEIDELSWIEAGFNNVASVPNGASKGNLNLEYIDNTYQYLENKERIYISVDNDEAGEALKKELIRRLGSERCYIIDLDTYKDANEVLCNESTEFLQRFYNKAQIVPIENVVKYSDEKEAYYDFLKNGLESSYKIGLNDFDQNFSTYSSQMIIVTGSPGNGKSDWVDQMALGYSLEYEMPIGYASVENKSKGRLNILHTDKLMAKLLGRFPEYSDIGTEDFNACEEYIDQYVNYIDFEGAYYLDNVLKKGEELVKRKGIKVFVIDPVNKITIKGKDIDDKSYTPTYLRMIDEFCLKNDVICIVVAHPIKVEHERITSMYRIRGTGDFYDMAHHGLSVYRDKELNYVEIINLKVKFGHLGKAGESSFFAWNPKNGRYSPINGNVLSGDFEPLFSADCWVQFLESNEELKEMPVPYADYDNEVGF